jgi:hypothetical protein
MSVTVDVAVLGGVQGWSPEEQALARCRIDQHVAARPPRDG